MPVLVDISNRTLTDIPRLMRVMADEIERGDHGEIVGAAAVFLDENGSPIVCGWGRAEDVQAIGILAIGQHWLAANRVQR